MRDQLNPLLATLEQQHRLPPGLLAAVAQTESAWNPRAVSPAGAMGLFQFMPATAREYGIDPYDPQQSAQAAAKKLRGLIDRYQGDTQQALRAYNWGEGNLASGRPMPRETQAYPGKVMAAMNQQQQQQQQRQPAQKPGTFDVRLPDGTVIKDVPEGTTKAALAAKLKSNGYAVPGDWLPNEAPKPPAAVQAGSALRDIPRQLGLTARYGIEGVGNLLNLGTEPIRAGLQVLGAPAMKSTGQLASGLADAIGLPQPADANERTIADAARLVAGGGGTMAAARGIAGATRGVTSAVAQQMANKPVQQLAGAATAGLAGGATREAGGGAVEQFGAALLGGLAGGAGADALGRAGATAANAVRRAVTPAKVMEQRVDQTINLTLQRSGVDWSQVPERVKQSVRAEAAAAMDTGQPLNAEALQRLIIMQRAGVKPTVGQLTQDPGQITREKNLAKTGANSTNPGLQALPELENANIAQLLRRLDETGAADAPDAMQTGQAIIGRLQGGIDAKKGEIASLYQAARDSAGRSLPLEGGTFTARASQLLDENLLGYAVPDSVAKRLNQIAQGEVPFTVEFAEQLKTVIGNIGRADKGGATSKAMGLIRQALDETPLQGSARVNPGNLPAVPGTVPPSTAPGTQAIEAFNRARAANRQLMQAIENNPALKAVYDGVEPDAFVRKYIIGAPAAEVGRLRQMLDPQTAGVVRQNIARYLRDAATGGDSDVVKFGGASYRNAFRAIEPKLKNFFSPEEIQALRDVGDAAKYLQAQPAGSAVNNSNSGALVLGRGLDFLETLAQKAPVGRDAITGVLQGVQQRQILAPRNALSVMAPQERTPVNPLIALIQSLSAPPPPVQQQGGN